LKQVVSADWFKHRCMPNPASQCPLLRDVYATYGNLENPTQFKIECAASTCMRSNQPVQTQKLKHELELELEKLRKECWELPPLQREKCLAILNQLASKLGVHLE